MSRETYLTREEIRRAAGRLIIGGFDGVQLTAELRELLRETGLLGVILFKRNLESPEQAYELNRELKLWRRAEPLLCSVDQEGGRVARLRAPATEWPPMRQVGEWADPVLAAAIGQALARELRAMSFDVDYAPVLDVDTNPANPVIGDRALSREPARVAELGAALVRGLQEAGVGAVGKHFPGHGDTDKDSHLALPKVSHDLERLRAIEWPPFAAASAAGLGAVMTAHVVVEALDAEHPATLSPAALAPLRRELGFSGVIISDDVEMKAVADHYDLDAIASRGLQAGVDVFLACHKPEVILGLYRAIVQAVERGAVSHTRLRASENRALAWRERYFQAPGERHALATWVGCRAHQALVEELAERQSRS